MDEIGRKETLKRKKYIFIKEKIAIWDRLNSEELVKNITKELRLNESTVWTIRKNGNKIRKIAFINSLLVLRKIVHIKDFLISKIKVFNDIGGWLRPKKYSSKS